MRFLLLNQFYPPDPAPTGQYLHHLAQALAQRGHQVEVFCSRRSYDGTQSYAHREMIADVTIHRLWATGFGRSGFLGKLCDYLSFCLSLLLALLFRRNTPDLILALSTPPYLGVLSKVAAWRHDCRHAHWVMDLYPDVLFAHGRTQRSGWICRQLEALSRFQFRGAQPIVALGPGMAQRVATYSSSSSYRNDAVSWFPLWSDATLSPWPEAKANLLRIERGWREKDIVFLYSGNMGLGHCFGDFLAAAKTLGPNGPRWVFCGDGKRRPEIESFARLHPEARIELLAYVPKSQLREHLCAADVHLLSLDPAWQGFMVPSKLQASFAVGRPVIYVGGRDCETAGWILESGGGWVVAPHDAPGLRAAIAEATNPIERRRRGQAGFEFARRHFNQSITCAHFAALLEKTIDPCRKVSASARTVDIPARRTAAT